ncbi:MAG: hypothetical protein E7773_10240 [Sphingomonas sp.]|uniref:hypothetical protein n=1 Tax=Sphingomonas sp. TaxID=28214 RepID=UPI0011FD39E7|nr:hypothetical protein [Sphingomonas sp.]THD35717.1 MAG: hypothetical protein E7773_10240 [Sphingomonas sp.]
MSNTVFIRPLSFTATSSTPVAGSAANLAVDMPSLVWRGASGISNIIIDLGASAVSYDYVALIGTNLRSTDNVQVQTGTAATGTGSYNSGLLTAWTGTKPSVASAVVIVPLPATRTERYVRIDITSTSNPDGYVQIARVVIGKAMKTGGIDVDAEMGFVDQSVVTNGTGYTTVQALPVLTSWKFSTGWISDVDWRQTFAPFMQAVGINGAFLFIVDDGTPANWQTDAVFGRFTTKTAGKSEFYNAWRIEATVTELAP